MCNKIFITRSAPPIKCRRVFYIGLGWVAISTGPINWVNILIIRHYWIWKCVMDCNGSVAAASHYYSIRGAAKDRFYFKLYIHARSGKERATAHNILTKLLIKLITISVNARHNRSGIIYKSCISFVERSRYSAHIYRSKLDPNCWLPAKAFRAG